MKIAYVTLFDATDVRNWSGTDLHIWKALHAQGIEIELVGNLRHGRSLMRKARKAWGQYVERREFLHFWDVDTAKDYSADVGERLRSMHVDAVLSPSPIPLAYLKCQQPKVLWTDASFAGLSRMYAEFDPARLCRATVRNARAIDAAVGRNCDRLIFAADWGAQCAISDTGVAPEKVAVVPYGANLEVRHTREDVARMAESRGRGVIRLLFIGVDWGRKGPAKAIEVVKSLRERGVDVELTMVGCLPPEGVTVPSFVKLLGFISKASDEGRERLFDLYRKSHFLIVPTVAEAYGLVFAEASAFGVPSLSHRVGGVPTIVRDDVNGRLFDMEQPVSDWADWVAGTLQGNRLAELATSSFAEYEARLNWRVAGASVAAILRDRVAMKRVA